MTNVEFTSEAIRSAKFKERLRGYPPEEVDAFLERCASALEQLTDRLAEMNARALRAEAALAGNSEADESVRRTLVLAQRTAEMAVREANEEATQIRSAARTEADRIVTEVKIDAHRVESDAAQRAAAIEQDAEHARAAAMEQAASTIDAANITAEATLRDAARQAAALESEITEEVTRRRSEIEAEIDSRRLQALQEIEESVSSLRVEREQLSTDVSTLGARLDAERSHVLEALRSATARLDAVFAGSLSPETSAPDIAPLLASDTWEEDPTSVGQDRAEVEGAAADPAAFDPAVVDHSAEVRGAVVDVPVVAEPVADGPMPVADGPVFDQPVADAVLDQPVADGPVFDQPVANGPVFDQPVADGLALDGPVVEQPVDETSVPASLAGGMVADVSLASDEPPGDESADGHGWPTEGPVAEGPVAEWPGADESAEMGRPIVEGPSVDESSVGEFAAVGLHDGGEARDDADAPSLTVVDGWATPGAPDAAERRFDDEASDPWDWSPEPEVAAEPAATWFPDAVLEGAPSEPDHVSAGDAWGAWSDDPGSPWPGPHGHDPTPESPEPSDAGAGRSTIFQPTAGWASSADATPASEPWSVWGTGRTSADAAGAGTPTTEASTWTPAWQAEAQSRRPAPTAWEPVADASTATWRGDDPQSSSDPAPVGSYSPTQPPATPSDPTWGSMWTPPEPAAWAAPSRDEPGAWTPATGETEPGQATGTPADSPVGTDIGASAGVGTSASVPLAVAPDEPDGWEPAPGDLHDPWRDLPQPGDAGSQADDPPPPRLLFTLEDDGRPAEPGGDSSPDAKPRKSLLGRRRL